MVYMLNDPFLTSTCMHMNLSYDYELLEENNIVHDGRGSNKWNLPVENVQDHGGHWKDPPPPYNKNATEQLLNLRPASL